MQWHLRVRDCTVMNDYVIGAGAVLTAGPTATSRERHFTLKPMRSLAPTVRAALIDFESSSRAELTKVVVMATGWNARRVKDDLVAPLLARGECSLTDILVSLAEQRNPRSPRLRAVARRRRNDRGGQPGGRLARLAPLEAIRRAALISGQTFSRWPSPPRAA